MRRAATVRLFLFALTATAASSAAQTPASRASPRPDSTARYRGRLLGVFDDETGNPVEGAIVADALTGDNATTTITGTVLLSFIREKGSLVVIRKLGYEPWSAVLDPADTIPIAVLLHKMATLAPDRSSRRGGIVIQQRSETTSLTQRRRG